MYALFCFLFLILNVGFSQTTFQRVLVENMPNTYGIYPSCAVENDKNGIFIGSSVGYRGTYLKVDSIGDLQWSFSIEAINNPGIVSFQSVLPTKDNNALYLGTIRNLGIVEGPIIALKVTPAGDTLWSTILEESHSSSGYTCGAELPDSSYLISWSNYINSPNFGMARISSQGSVLWSKIVTFGSYTSISAVEVLSDNSILLAGRELLINIDNDGNVLWSKQFLGLYFDDIRAIPNGFMTTTQNLAGFAPYREFNKFSNAGIMEWVLEYSSSVSAGPVSNYHSALIPWDDATSLFHYQFEDQFENATALLIDTNGTIVSDIMSISMTGRGVTLTKDNGAIFTGFGPQFGIKGVNYDPQIGLVKTDSLLHSSSCIEISTITTNFTPISAGSPVVLDSIGVPQLVSIPLVVSIPVLEEIDTCVAYIASIPENELRLLVYPNFSDGIFKFETNSLGRKKIEITNLLGEIVFSTTIDSQNFIVDLTREKSGLYTYSVEIDGFNQSNGKLLLLK